MFKYLVLNHIPRCGGTSLRQSFYDASAIHGYFGKCPRYISGHTHNNISLFHKPHLIESIHPETLIFVDHSLSYFIEQIFNLDIDQTYRILTIRNPIHRFISHVHFFYNEHIDNLSENVIKYQLNDIGNITIHYLTFAQEKYRNKSLKSKYLISRSLLDEYNFIFKIEEQILLEKFNETNPFGLQLHNHHYNRSKIDISSLQISQKTKNLIYQTIKLEIKLLEKFYEMDL